MTVSLTDWIEADKRVYRANRRTSDTGLVGIKDAIEKGTTGIFSGVTEDHKIDIFYELCFCLCVAQSKAVKAQEAIDILRQKNYYENALPLKDVVAILTSRVRFHNRKSPRLQEARKLFLETDFWPSLCTFYASYSVADEDKFTVLNEAREWLIKKVNGFSLKGASHFLRNVGMPGLAILDVHVIAGMVSRGLIPEKYLREEKGKTKLEPGLATYHAVEQIEIDYAGKVGIPIEEFDLLLWSQRTGYVFK